MQIDLPAVRKLVGASLTKEQLRYIDCFVTDRLALFMPVGGACFYALTPEHTHPSYMFVINFDDATRVRMNPGTCNPPAAAGANASYSPGGRVIKGEPPAPAGSGSSGTAVITGMPGKIFALSPDIPHQELPSDRPPRYICVMIAKALFETQYRHYSRKKAPVFRGNLFEAGQVVVQICKRFMIEADNRMPGGAAVLHALSIEICHAIIRQIVEAPVQKDRLTGRVEVNRVIEYLNSRLEAKITLETLAGIGHLSASHFSRVFREETGQSPMEYVHHLRLERAKKLLLAGDNSITEIALACGFNSPSYLSACFQKQYKLTPSEYQKRTRQRQ